MEIERKFKIAAFPTDLPLVYHGFVEQGYLSLDPEVRIRRNTPSQETPEPLSCKLCVKSDGALVREEVEAEITSEDFDTLARMLTRRPITKDFRVYQLDDGLKLEVSLVDEGLPSSFMYAEVEFPSVERAESFAAPKYLGEELTYVDGARMKDYWAANPDVE